MKKSNEEFTIRLCTCTPMDPCCPDVFFNPKTKQFRVEDDYDNQIELSQEDMLKVSEEIESKIISSKK